MPKRDKNALVAELHGTLGALRTIDRFGAEEHWTFERRRLGETLYLGRDDGQPLQRSLGVLGGHHGLNMGTMIEPSFQWPLVRNYLLAAMNAAPHLLEEIDRLEARAQELKARVQELEVHLPCVCPDRWASRHENNPTGHYVGCPRWGTELPVVERTAEEAVGDADLDDGA